VLISRANTPDLVGDVCLVSGEHSWRIIPDLIYRLQLNQKKILSQYLVFFLLCRSGRNQIQLDARGSNESMVKIGKTHLKAWIIPLPSKAEQTAIVHHIETQCSRIDAIINKLKKQINLFKEYRTALISEAVTGKIQIK
jgi:type I restriction enzyme S subunit